MPVDISSTTIEFHRFGGEPGFLQRGNPYIRTCGYQTAADQVVVEIQATSYELSAARRVIRRTARM